MLKNWNDADENDLRFLIFDFDYYNYLVLNQILVLNILYAHKIFPFSRKETSFEYEPHNTKGIPPNFKGMLTVYEM